MFFLDNENAIFFQIFLISSSLIILYLYVLFLNAIAYQFIKTKYNEYERNFLNQTELDGMM